MSAGCTRTYRRYARETADPAVALRAIMSEIARPCTIWGEKNPRYATRLETLRRSFPGAVVLFVLRDPREVVNSYLLHRDSTLAVGRWTSGSRTPWPKPWRWCRVAWQPLEAGDPELVVLRYEAFAARPRATLDAALGRWGLSLFRERRPRSPIRRRRRSATTSSSGTARPYRGRSATSRRCVRRHPPGTGSTPTIQPGPRSTPWRGASVTTERIGQGGFSTRELSDLLQADRPAVCFVTNIGDAVLTLPTFRALGEMFSAPITLICPKVAFDLCFQEVSPRFVDITGLPFVGTPPLPGPPERPVDYDALVSEIGAVDVFIDTLPWNSLSSIVIRPLLQRLAPTTSIGFSPDVRITTSWSPKRNVTRPT